MTADTTGGPGGGGMTGGTTGAAGGMYGGVIGFEAVTVTYEDAAAPVLRDFSLAVEEGELCLVAGRTGVGKSTVLGAINGLVPHFTGGALRGRVTVDGRDTSTHPPHVVGRTSVVRGSRGVVVEERPIARLKAIREITEEDVVAYLLPEIRRLILRG